jgi:predicted phage terminase large subunit-like protein
MVEIDWEIQKRKLEGSLIEFVKWRFEQKYKRPFILNWHHVKTCDFLEQVYRHIITRAVINLPPRYSKTEIAVISFVEWCLAKMPDSKFIHLSYSEFLALNNSSQIREDVKSDWFQKFWPIKTKQDSDSKHKWDTLQNGGVYATGTEGSITGFGSGRTEFGLFGGATIIDDPEKPEKASSETQRDKINVRLLETIMNRTNNPSETPVIIIMQRLHYDDMSGYALNGGTSEKWEHLCIPALNESGEPLWAYKHTLEQLNAIKRSSNRYFTSQYMQAPTIEEGAIIKRQWIKYYEVLPAHFDSWYISVDASFKESANSDYVVIQCWARKGSEYYLVDQIRDRMDFPTTITAFRSMCLRYPKVSAKLVEVKANGQAIVDTLKKEISGIIEVIPKESKEARLSAVAPMFEAGNIYLPQCKSFTYDFVEEITGFPFMKHDDCVDAMSQLLSWAQLNRSGGFTVGVIRR